MIIAYYTLSVICFITTIISTLPPTNWVVKFWDIGRLNLAMVMGASFLVGLFFLPEEPLAWIFEALLLVGIGYHISVVYDFFPWRSVELASTEKRTAVVKVIACNVRAKNKQYQRLVDLIQNYQPDIFILTEISGDWSEALSVFDENYPHQVLHPLENTYGICLYSKHPLENTAVKFLVEEEVPSIHATVLMHQQRIQLLALHPRPPAPWTIAENKDLELIKIAGMTNYNLLPTIVGGDLNDVGWSRITKNFKMISGLLDPRIGRGLYNTYNALLPCFRVPVDHFFVSKHFKLLQIKRLEKIGSDHFPVLLEVNLD